MTTAEKLKAKLLDLAIRGKLVPQDPKDEPADALLARIRDDKAKLVNEKKIKKEKPLPPVTEDEKPFDLPKGWAWCRLGEVSTVVRGSGIKRNETTREGVQCVRYGEIYTHYGYSFTKTFSFVSESLSARCQQAQNGDVLCTLTGENEQEIAKATAYLGHDQLVIGGDLARITNHPFDPKLLVFFLFSHFLIEQKAKACNGDLIIHISKSALEKLVIPLPPLAEQKRIVEKLETLLKAVDTLGACAETFDKLGDKARAKILDLAIRGKLVPQNPNDEPAETLLARIRDGKAKLVKEKKIKKEKPLPPIEDDEKPFDLPKGWTWCRLGNLCNYGKCESESNVPADAWALDLEDIEKNTGKLLRRVISKDRQTTGARHVFKKDMLLYSKLRTYLNKVLVADMDGYCVSEILPLDFGEFVDVRYARFVLMSPYFLEYTACCCYGVKMPRLGTNDGRNALFPLPPLEEQKRIVAKVEAMLAACEKLKGAEG